MKILVATDGSKSALQAVKYAGDLVKSIPSASITLVNVHDDAAMRGAEAFVGSKEVADYLHEVSEKELRPAKKLLDEAGVEHDVAIRTGHISQEIVQLAESGRFDLVVVGSKGRSAIADLLLGSVAQQVLATAKQPVLLVK